MSKTYGSALLLAAVVGFATAPETILAAAPQSVNLDFELEAAVAKLRPGMAEAEAREMMKRLAVDSGTVYHGGSGCCALYFALPSNRQVRLEVGWDDDDSFGVTEVGRIEPKQVWIRYDGDSIVVEQRALWGGRRISWSGQ